MRKKVKKLQGDVGSRKLRSSFRCQAGTISLSGSPWRKPSLSKVPNIGAVNEIHDFRQVEPEP
jgi:hypothetical protein